MSVRGGTRRCGRRYERLGRRWLAGCWRLALVVAVAVVIVVVLNAGSSTPSAASSAEQAVGRDHR